MAIRIKEKRERKKIPKKDKIILLLSFLLLVAVGGGYVLVLEYNERVDFDYREVMSQAREREETISTIEDWESVFAKDYQKINFIRELIHTKREAADFLTILEAVTHPQVYFQSLDLDAKEFEAHLEGTASNLKSFGQQVELMRKKGQFVEGDIPGLIRIRTSVLGNELSNYSVSFFLENNRLSIKATLPSGETKRSEVNQVENIGNTLENMTEVPLSAIIEEGVEIEDFHEKSINFTSRKIINEVILTKAEIRDESLEQDIDLEDFEEQIEEFSASSEVDFVIILKINPFILGIQE